MNAELKWPLEHLVNEMAVMQVFESGVREAIGNTNYACIMLALADARLALAATQEVNDER